MPYNDETFGSSGILGRAKEREVVLVRDLRDTLERLILECRKVPRPVAAAANDWGDCALTARIVF